MQATKAAVRERIVRPAAGRIVGRGALVGYGLLLGPLAAAAVLSWLNVGLGTWVARAGFGASLASMFVGFELLSLNGRTRCPACRYTSNARANYCDRCGTSVAGRPTGLEALAEGVETERGPLVERDEVRASVEPSRHGEDVLVAEHRDEETVLYRVDADVWDAISEETNGEVYV
jgi:hypothetical protein